MTQTQTIPETFLGSDIAADQFAAFAPPVPSQQNTSRKEPSFPRIPFERGEARGAGAEVRAGGAGGPGPGGPIHAGIEGAPGHGGRAIEPAGRRSAEVALEARAALT